MRAALLLCASLALAGCGAQLTPAMKSDVLEARRDSLEAAREQKARFTEHLAANPEDLKGAVAAGFDANVNAQAGSLSKSEKESEGIPSWAIVLLGVLGIPVTGGAGLAVVKGLQAVVGVVMKKMMEQYEAQPFVGKNGETLDEGDLVSTVAALKAKAATP